MAPHWFGGYVSIFSPQGVFGFSYPAVLHLYPVDYCRCCNLERKLFMPATGARPKKTKINLMDCICLMCSGVEMRCRLIDRYFFTYFKKVTVKRLNRHAQYQNYIIIQTNLFLILTLT